MFAIGIIAGAIIFLVSGCTNIEASKVGNPVSVHIPVFVKPDIETKNDVITGSATVHSLFGIFSWGPSCQAVGIDYGTTTAITGGALGDLLSFTYKSELAARNAAAYEATKSANADIILAPQYVITTKDYLIYKSINCKVKGYPGFIKGVRVVDCPKNTKK